MVVRRSGRNHVVSVNQRLDAAGLAIFVLPAKVTRCFGIVVKRHPWYTPPAACFPLCFCTVDCRYIPPVRRRVDRIGRVKQIIAVLVLYVIGHVMVCPPLDFIPFHCFTTADDIKRIEPDNVFQRLLVFAVIKSNYFICWDNDVVEGAVRVVVRMHPADAFFRGFLHPVCQHIRKFLVGRNICDGRLKSLVILDAHGRRLSDYVPDLLVYEEPEERVDIVHIRVVGICNGLGSLMAFSIIAVFRRHLIINNRLSEIMIQNIVPAGIIPLADSHEFLLFIDGPVTQNQLDNFRLIQLAFNGKPGFYQV